MSARKRALQGVAMVYCAGLAVVYGLILLVACLQLLVGE